MLIRVYQRNVNKNSSFFFIFHFLRLFNYSFLFSLYIKRKFVLNVHTLLFIDIRTVSSLSWTKCKLLGICPVVLKHIWRNYLQELQNSYNTHNFLVWTRLKILIRNVNLIWEIIFSTGPSFTKYNGFLIIKVSL